MFLKELNGITVLSLNIHYLILYQLLILHIIYVININNTKNIKLKHSTFYSNKKINNNT